MNRLETQGKGLLDYSVVYPKTHASLVHPTIEWNGSWSLQSLFIHLMFFSGHALIGHSLCVSIYIIAFRFSMYCYAQINITKINNDYGRDKGYACLSRRGLDVVKHTFLANFLLDWIIEIIFDGLGFITMFLFSNINDMHSMLGGHFLFRSLSINI